ncbi:Rieske 2Fe-2S domain-containing protein [Paenibacillus sp. JTLBN-2024]
MVVQNADVAKHFIAGKVGLIQRKADDLQPGEGGVISYDGRRAGGYRDDEGNLYIVDTTCSHMGCEVEWNDGERSWDCPCHGSRYTCMRAKSLKGRQRSLWTSWKNEYKRPFRSMQRKCSPLPNAAVGNAFLYWTGCLRACVNFHRQPF